MTTIKAMLESNAGLMPAERQALHALLTRPYRNLDEVEQAVRAVFPAWFIYRGGSHVALHVSEYRRDVDAPRLAIWTEERNPRADAIENAKGFIVRQGMSFGDAVDRACNLSYIRDESAREDVRDAIDAWHEAMLEDAAEGER